MQRSSARAMSTVLRDAPQGEARVWPVRLTVTYGREGWTELWQTVAKLWQNYNPDTVFVGEMKGNVHASWLLIATTNSGVPEPKAFRKEWTHRAP